FRRRGEDILVPRPQRSLPADPARPRRIRCVRAEVHAPGVRGRVFARARSTGMSVPRGLLLGDHGGGAAGSAAPPAGAHSSRTPGRPAGGGRRRDPGGWGTVTMDRDAQRKGLTAINGTNALITVIVIVQMWLVSAALESALAGRDDAA